MYIVSVLIAIMSGLLISMQGIINSVGSKAIGSPAMIAWLSIIQAVPPLLLILFRQPSVGLGQSIIHGFKWYAISGILGIIIVTCMSFSISSIGSLTAFVIVVLGQVIGAAIADQFGLFGTPVKPINTMRIVSIIIIIVGVGLLLKSEPKDNSSEHNPLSSTVAQTERVS